MNSTVDKSSFRPPLKNGVSLTLLQHFTEQKSTIWLSPKFAKILIVHLDILFCDDYYGVLEYEDFDT